MRAITKKFLMVAGAAMLLSACETAPGTDGSTNGGVDGVAVDGGAGVRMGHVVPGEQSDLEAHVGDRVFFDYDNSVVTPEGQATLRRQAEWLQQYPYVNVIVEGHCDERGTREYNLALGERRANAVRNFLVNMGVESGRVSTTSYGKERPTCIEAHSGCWSQNRRSVTVVTN